MSLVDVEDSQHSLRACWCLFCCNLYVQ